MGAVIQLYGRPHIHIFCWLVWNLLPYNTATRQLRGLYWIFYFALKEPVVCRQLWCTKQRGYPCQISSHSKRRNMKNCQGPTREPDRKATPPIKTVPWKTGFYMFSEWNEFFKRQWSAALIIQYRGENVYKTGSSLVAKDET